MTTTVTDTTAAVLGKHVQAVLAHDLDGVMSDFSEDSVILTAQGTVKGLDAIRAFFAGAFQLLTKEAIAEMKVYSQEVNGEFAFVVWSAGAAIPFAADTFCVRDGIIIMQAFAAHLDA